ncbi:MAG TPA: Fe-S-cluster-containing hydrogenase [Steroidobacteraceae bacterium]
MPPLSPTRSAAVEEIRRELAGKHGAAFWRSLEELLEQPQGLQRLRQAVPQVAALDPVLDRRSFLGLLGASLALGGLAGCSGPPPEQIVPWVRSPPGLRASEPELYATTLQIGAEVIGVLVQTYEGRPTKIEGNPAHPASLGSTDAMTQAAVLELWDPDRSQAPVQHGSVASWDDFQAQAAASARQFAHDGRGLHVLSGRIESPSLAAQREALLHRYPGARWHQYEAIDDDNAREGALLAFGSPLRVRHRFDRAAVIVSLEADFLGSMPGHVRAARDFAAKRRPAGSPATMSRLYVVEATMSLTGTNADHRWPLRATDISALAHALATRLGVVLPSDSPGSAQNGTDHRDATRLQALVGDLQDHRGASLVIAGETQPPLVHALAILMNQILGNIGTTVEYFESPEPREGSAASLRALSESMAAGEVDTLWILDGNPVYSAPADLHFAARLASVRHTVHVGLFRDETAARCAWHLPRSHSLESWSDLRTYDGTASIVQPVISPLYDVRSLHEILALLLGSSPTDGRSIVRATWSGRLGLHDEQAWESVLREGVIRDSAPAALGARAELRALPPDIRTRAQGSLDLLFRPDPTVWDGRYANNGWLQELPKVVSQLTWGNAAWLSPALATRQSLANGDVIELRSQGRSLQAPVWIVPGQADETVVVSLGYGRTVLGHVGERLGYDANRVRSASAPWQAQCTMAPTGHHLELVTTQRHHVMQAEVPVRTGTLAQFRANPAFMQADSSTPPSLYPQRPAGEYRWGMSIDLNSCIGCGACTLACQAENNIPVVGAEEVARGRELHWIRVDRYFQGTPARPHVHHQPVPCMHCEHAPCELVCPVGATVHDSEGLNVQVYNRCIGTRFCSNNCPYKVRRFNFLQYADLRSPTLAARRNPEVSVRNRGVMEKCTYCIQRIEVAHIEADRGMRRIGDGEVVTACQAACPAKAITFGDTADPAAAVSREKASSRNYLLLEDLNTRPQTSYLGSLRNPHPELQDDT